MLPSVEEVLKTALELGYIEQNYQALLEMMNEMDNPIIQILIKNVKEVVLIDEHDIYLEFLPEMIAKYKEVLFMLFYLLITFQLIQHSNPDVRKNVVFSIVDLYFINEEEMLKYIDTFSPNHQKLINIYIEKRNETSGVKK